MICSFSKVKLLGLILTAIGMWPLAAAAAENGYWTRWIPGESDDYKIALAESGRPLWYVLRETTTLEELIRQRCGSQSEAVFHHYVERSGKLNALDDTTKPIAAGNAVAIPYCHNVTTNVEVSIRRGDTINQILAYRTGLNGRKSVNAVVSANMPEVTRPLTDSDLRDFSTSLQESSILTLPYAAERRMFIPVDSDISPFELIRQYPPNGIALADARATYEPVDNAEGSVGETIEFLSNLMASSENVASNVDAESLQGGQDTEIKFVDFVKLESGLGSSDCADGPGIEHFDAELFLQRLSIEKSALEAGGRQVSPSVVGVIDSGIAKIGEGIFDQKYFKANEAELLPGSILNQTDDGNIYIDDVWGINFQDHTGKVRPFPNASPKVPAHGSQVASLVLGGLTYLGTTQQSPPLTKLIIVNFGDRLRGIQPPEKLFDAVDYLVERNSDIVNMSLSAEIQLLGLKERIDRQKGQVLFIVAAGNTNPQGRRLGLSPRYPASWGGESDRPNLITVAATDKAGNRAAFSNYGDEVDLYAPGCNIRTIDNADTEVVDFGTSMAAAHVSFVSSVLRALGGTSMWPARVKHRLIASAQYRDSFPTANKEGYILDEIKAVSITHDVIEVTSQQAGQTELRFGRIQDVDSLRQYCQGDDKDLLDNIHKVTPNIDVNGTRMIRFLVSPSGAMDAVFCVQENDDLPIPGYVEGGMVIPEIRISDVRDIVTATLRL